MARKEEPKDPKKTAHPTPKPRVHQDLSGLEVSIDQFGELKSSMDIEKINEFLNKNVDDKKLAERDDYDNLKKKGKPKRKGK
jgi:hypothetical protein